MQLHKNKIVIFSGVYLSTLVVIALLFGVWHNTRVNGTGNYFSFLLLIFLVTLSLSWFYFTLFKAYRKEMEEKASLQKAAEENQQETTTENTEERETADTNKFDKEAFISGIIPENKKPVNEFGEDILQNLARKMNIVQGLFYLKPKNEDTFEAIARYAYYSDQDPPGFKAGESLPGQAVKDKRVVTIQNIPENYIPVVSGLGNSKPKNLIMIPVVSDNEAVGLIEIAIFSNVENELELTLKELGGIIGKNIIKLMK